ncbi:hypothetical protein [Methanofollis fontis]|uniref:Uncharacterized protein n=1 Tax=Methanofollis fontis TaxID=2052832 RepID=A0A483CM81_9EURY|nr:hypothetical protein [Methanofollis fontis]TAJ44099.1 hypothetical protein CUJ86_08690 [Methanofollis fontis]
MSVIQNAIAGGAAVYALILLIQALEQPSVSVGALAAALLLAVAGSLLWTGNGHRLKTMEMTLLWGCVGLFGIYGLLSLGGIV